MGTPITTRRIVCGYDPKIAPLCKGPVANEQNRKRRAEATRKPEGLHQFLLRFGNYRNSGPATCEPLIQKSLDRAGFIVFVTKNERPHAPMKSSLGFRKV
jgi:hypothetical protein